MNFCDCVKNKKCYFYRFFWVFFPRCYYESLKNETILDFQCYAQISFSRFRDQRHIVLKLFFFFLELPKNRKKNRFYFSYLPLLQYLCFHSKGQGVWGGVYTVQRTKLKLFCINPPFGTIRWVPFLSLPCGIPLEMGSAAFPAPQHVPSPVG